MHNILQWMEWQQFYILILWWRSCMTELLPPDDTNYSRTISLEEMVLDIATQNFEDAYHLIVFGSSDALLESLPFPRLVASLDEMHTNNNLCANAVILFINDDDVNYLSNVPRKWLRAYFILASPHHWYFQDIKNTFSLLWNAEIANVILLLTNDTSHNSVQAFTFNPYQLHSCQLVQPVLMDKLWFPKVKVANLQNCHLNFTLIELAPDVIVPNKRTSLSKWHKKKKHSSSQEGILNINDNNLAGVEVELVQTLAEKMNFTPLYSLPRDGSHWGYLMDNGTITGMSGDVFKSMSDVGVGHVTPNLQLWDLLEYSSTLGMDCYGWGIPLGAGHRIPSWKTLTSEFSTLTWGLIFLALCLSAMCMWALSHRDARDRHRYRIPCSTFCFTCNTMITAPSTSQPESIGVRAFVALWLLYSIVVSVAYQAELGSIVTVPWMRPDIQSLQELLESNLQLRLPWKVHAQLEKVEDEKALALVNRFTPTGKVMENILNLTENDREFAFLSSSKSLTYYASRSGWKFHVMTDGCMMNHHTSLVLRMGSPLVPRINVLIQRFLETGLVVRWEKNYTVRSHGSKIRRSGLSMPHLLGAFMALALGQSFAFLVLLMEALFERTTK